MNQYARGQVVGHFGDPVIIHSAQERSDGGFIYLVEATDGSLFRARHETLKPPLPVFTQPTDQALPFEVVCSRAAKIRRGKAKRRD